jgi:hypothetical protein
MPRKLSRGKRLATLTAIAAGALATAPGAALAACPDLPTSQPFALWGDAANYSLAPGGNFEGSLTWARTGAPTLVAPSNPFVLSGPGLRSVRLRGQDSITSPTVCVSDIHPYMRFVARAQDTTSRLVLEVLWTDDGVNKVDVLEEHQADEYQVWKPSKLVPLGTKLPTGSKGAHEVRLRLKLKDGAGSWLVDDVFIDPASRG